MKHQFTYALHDTSDSYERHYEIAEQIALTEAEVEALQIGRPFYEVILNCELDDETGRVTILGVAP